MLEAFKLIWIIFPFVVNVDSSELPFITNVQYLITVADDISKIMKEDGPIESLFSEPDNPLIKISKIIDNIFKQTISSESDPNFPMGRIFNKIVQKFPLDEAAQGQITKFVLLIQEIDKAEESYSLYVHNVSSYDKKEIEPFIMRATTIKKNGLRNVINGIYNAAISSKSSLNRGSIFEHIKRSIAAVSANSCDLDISYHHRMFKIFSTIIIVEFRAFLILIFSYKMLEQYRNESFTTQVANEQKRFVSRLEQYLLEFQQALNETPRDIYRCDPEVNELGKTYWEMEGFYTRFAIHQYQFKNHDLCALGCSELPPYEPYDKCFSKYMSYTFSSETIEFCTHHPCNGRLGDCLWIGQSDICELPQSSRKRYDFIYSRGNGKYYGGWTDCSGDRTFTKIDSFKSDDSENCGMCLCTCIEEFAESPAIRTFSLRPQISNIEENKVVSDVRFVLKDKLIHIQIKESPMLEGGQLNRNQSSWIPLEDFKYAATGRFGTFSKIDGDQEIPLIRDVDFAFLTSNQMVLNMDTISAGAHYVVTGVRLNHETPSISESEDNSENENVSPIQLEIHVTPFNLITGQLNATEDNPSIWLTAASQPIPSKEYNHKRTKIDMKFEVSKSRPLFTTFNLTTNEFVSFDFSSTVNDAGQTTLPYIDSQSVATKNDFALGGIGLIYRGDKQYAGTVALKVLTLDFLEYINPKMTEKQINYYFEGQMDLTNNIPRAD